ncbi:hypothetical protein [Pontimicrobium aquaticum]|uniref:Lipoprotein n=1 Tax=Pontimicrobium aquaticum TaxID=2565367 RepID=A0A4U0EVD9_9FLAO|nr:hypothetical protein [Pontimicrobium aquaticum]TJY35790.1 hypothetical protein E5167_07930 [Pontimicrobium aquaticum]
MKKSITLIILISALVISCKNSEKQEDIIPSKEVLQEQTDLLSTQWMNDIQLNNGSKWETNIETTEGVEKMQELLKAQSTASIDDYHQLANQLNEVKNKVVKECTMKGASHDNLHIWLYPLIEKVSALSKTNDIDEASKIKQSIIDNVNAYTTYFQ